MSLFGGILAGAMQGGGAAYQVASRDRGIAEHKAALEAIRAKNELDRQTYLEELRSKNNLNEAGVRHGYRKDELGILHTQGVERIIKQDELAGARAGEDRTWRSDESAAQREFLADEGEANRKNRIAAASIRSPEQPRLIPQGDGTYLQLMSDGSTRLVEHNGQPVKGPKDVDQRTLEVISAMKSERDSLIRNDPTGSQEQVNRINQEIRGMLQGDTTKAPTSQWDSLDPTKRTAIVSRLESFRSDPSKLSGAIEEARRLGVPVDVLSGLTSKGGQAPAAKEEPKAGLLSGAAKPGFASEPVLSERDLEVQRELDAVRARRESSAARASEVKSITPERISSMSAEAAREVLERFGTELSGRQRAALNARLR
jgi:hypothetical protein